MKSAAVFIFCLFQCFIIYLSRVFPLFTFLGCFHFSPFSGIFVLLYRECYGFGRAFFTLRRFLPYTPSHHLAQPAFIKASLGAGSSSLKVARPRNTDPTLPICLLESQSSAKGISR